MDGQVAKEGNREAGGKEEEKEGRQGGGTWEMLFPDTSKAKQKTSIKAKLVVKGNLPMGPTYIVAMTYWGLEMVG